MFSYNQTINNCDGMNVDLTQEVNPNSCTELHTFNANCMDTGYR